MSQIAPSISREYECLVPPQTEVEFSTLKQSIKSNGFDDAFPILVNDDGVILDGHHRFRACKDLGIQPVIRTKTFTDPLLEKKFVIECNLNRRHLTPFARGELVLKLKPIYEEIGKKNMSAGGKDKARFVNVDKPSIDTRKLLAEKAGISAGTLSKIERISQVADEETKSNLRAGKKSTINKVFNGIKKDERRKEIMAGYRPSRLGMACYVSDTQYQEPEPKAAPACADCNHPVEILSIELHWDGRQERHVARNRPSHECKLCECGSEFYEKEAQP